MNLKKNLKYGYWLLAISYWLLAGCGNNQSTPTQGKLKIEIDESYSQLFAAELESFHALYKGSTIEAIYKPEGEIINDLLADSCRVVILNRELNQKEKENF